jgi:hypothetical protein
VQGHHAVMQAAQMCYYHMDTALLCMQVGVPCHLPPRRSSASSTITGRICMLEALSRCAQGVFCSKHI